MSTIILLRLDWFIGLKIMFIAVLRIIQMKKEFKVLLCFQELLHKKHVEHHT